MHVIVLHSGMVALLKQAQQLLDKQQQFSIGHIDVLDGGFILCHLKNTKNISNLSGNVKEHW